LSIRAREPPVTIKAIECEIVDKGVVERSVSLLEAEGIAFVTGVAVGCRSVVQFEILPRRLSSVRPTTAASSRARSPVLTRPGRRRSCRWRWASSVRRRAACLSSSAEARCPR
jgi:hypothetical protein